MEIQQMSSLSAAYVNGPIIYSNTQKSMSIRDPLSSMKISFVILLFIICKHSNAQESTTGNSIVGIWKGTSLCQVKNSPCHDESVVYYITKVNGSDTFNIDAFKVIDGKEVDMGIIGGKWDSENSRLLSNFGNSRFTFNFKNDNLDGTLYNNGILYRIFHLTKQP